MYESIRIPTYDTLSSFRPQYCNKLVPIITNKYNKQKIDFGILVLRLCRYGNKTQIGIWDLSIKTLNIANNVDDYLLFFMFSDII